MVVENVLTYYSIGQKSDAKLGVQIYISRINLYRYGGIILLYGELSRKGAGS